MCKSHEDINGFITQEFFNHLEIKNRRISLIKKASKEVVARQKSPKVYDMNASIYGKEINFLNPKVFCRRICQFMKCPKKNQLISILN